MTGDQIPLLVCLNICSIVEGKGKHNHFSILLTVAVAKHWQDREYYEDGKVRLCQTVRKLPVNIGNNSIPIYVTSISNISPYKNLCGLNERNWLI